MLPSVLASQVRRGIADFLETTFPISTPFFHGIVDRLLQEEGGVFREPYLSIELPFLSGDGGADYFPDLPLAFRPYLHQERAFERLRGPNPKSTLVATGTGSGKTECFLWPILDHCYRHRSEPGIKAILIYPMNALASDQAGRIARAVWQNPKLKGRVTAGLYVGETSRSMQAVMTEQTLISRRETLRRTPPDILLTNYKMLDYLLVRPIDYPLWKDNRPETLRYLVTDELHTFDGAQGTDLACLIRRLKERLKTPADFLCAVGTSATLGSGSEHRGLLAYAARIFGEPFDDDAVITEYRQTAAEFLSAMAAPHPVAPDQAARLDPDNFTDAAGYISAQHEFWFGRGISAEEFPGDEWRLKLATRLTGTLFFQNMLKALGGRPQPCRALIERLEHASPFPGATAKDRRNRLYSMVSLVSEARKRVAREGGGSLLAPFLRVRLQLWLRELRRMVCEVKPSPHLRFADDLNADQLRCHLPLVHCRECGATGWAGLMRRRESRINPDLRPFYKTFFANGPNVIFLFPTRASASSSPGDAVPARLCGRCLWLTVNTETRECGDCGAPNLLDVDCPNVTVKVGNRVVSQRHCPYCQAQNALTIVGSRAASLSAVLISQLFASRFNDHKKMLAFSDSVQDAAHRAAFFAARTYRFNFRAALTQFVAREGDGLTLAELPQAFIAAQRARLRDPVRFVSLFLPPDMAWLADFEEMRKKGRIPAGSRLERQVERRIGWEILSGYGFSCRIGRTLEKTGCSLVQVDGSRLAGAVDSLLAPLRNEIGPLRDLDPAQLRRFLLGIITHIKNRGGILGSIMPDYVKNRANTYWLNKAFVWMPRFGAKSRVPAFPASRAIVRFDPLLRTRARGPTWYRQFASKCFDELELGVAALVEPLYRLVLKGLGKAGILEALELGRETAWGLRPDALRVSTQVLQMRCGRCGHQVSVATGEESDWRDAPCRRRACAGKLAAMPQCRDYYGDLYARGDLVRLYAAEHSGILARDEREALERRFKAAAADRLPFYENLLSCTPTLELGIDIGDLSSLLLCSVPPAQANYLQRVGRTGRRDGNSLAMTVANARPHDLYFFACPEQMLAGRVEPPGVFLDAPAVLERQFTAFCFDRFVESGVAADAIPKRLATILNGLKAPRPDRFPYSLLAFIDRHRTALLDRFLELFDIDRASDSGIHLDQFVTGDKSREGSLAYRTISGLHQLEQERQSLRRTVALLFRRLKAKKAEKARDKNYQQDLRDLNRERQALSKLAATIGGREVLGYFVDEGLLPNYAFPEAGIVLKSVIYRKRDGTDAGKRYDTKVYEYQRPAASAIAELAPANRFYAEGRRVTVDQVNMDVAKVEDWRLCRSCSYTELIGKTEETKSCPRCGDTLFGDQGQRRQMLRMRQVFATTSDRDSRFGDQSDNREPVFYEQQMLPDVAPGHVRKAFRLDCDELPFGFEHLDRVTLREVNFGPAGPFGQSLRVAGVEMPRRGFTLCRSCGKVQRSSEKPIHALSCKARAKEAAESFTDCVYLYRDFSSEAIRILLPITAFTREETLHSFIAALHLGLKRHFEGNVDHLRTTEYDEPCPGSPLRRHYLLLYDAVPGGTGYLKQLMIDPSHLFDVFRKSLAVLRSCSCRHEAGRDGCYRCLYAYRRSHEMKATSRRSAVDLLAALLDRKDRLIQVEDLSNTPMNTLFESVLEAEFIEALRRTRRLGPAVTLKREVVHGKPGYLLKMGRRAYLIEPQVELSEADGVALPSRADFLLRPVGSEALPIAVYTDGLDFHKGRVGKDLAQRMAVVASGRYLVWSLTWSDVRGALSDSERCFRDYLDPAGAPAGDKLAGFLSHYGAKELRGAARESSFEWLVRWLVHPDPAEALRLWRTYAFVQAVIRLDPGTIGTKAAQERFRSRRAKCLPAVLAASLDDPGDELCGLSEDASDAFDPLLFVWTTPAAVKEGDASLMRVAGFLQDDAPAAAEDRFRERWGGFLRLYNLFQFLDRAIFVTSTGVAAGAYDGLLRQPPAAGEAPPKGFVDIFAECDRTLHPLLRLLAQSGMMPPAIPPFELTSRMGETIAEAEFGWPVEKVALLTKEQTGGRDLFVKAGFTCFPLDEVVAEPTLLVQQIKSSGLSIDRQSGGEVASSD